MQGSLLLNQADIDAITTLIDSRYPSILTSPSVLTLVRDIISQRVYGTIIAADLWSGDYPVSSQVLFWYDNRIMAVDWLRVWEDKTSWNVEVTLWDIRDTKMLRVIRNEFFEKIRSLWKNKFDVIFLSNVLNYLVYNDEHLLPWEVSQCVEEFFEEFIAKNLTRKWVLVIQNGDKRQRYRVLKQNQINDYFSVKMEQLLQRYFTDIMYVWLAGIQERQSLMQRVFKRGLSKDPIRWFTGVNELHEIQQDPDYITAVNVRCMIRKDI